MITPELVSAVIPTRGDCGLARILNSIRSAGIKDVVVWDNSVEEDLGIYGRYEAISRAQHDVIVTQDDDVFISSSQWLRILAEYEPDVVTVNYPEPWDVPWVARGAVFDRDLPAAAFSVYLDSYEFDGLFTHRICDAVFGLLSDVNVVDVGSRDLPHGLSDGRVSTSKGWYDRDRPEAIRRCEALKVAA